MPTQGRLATDQPTISREGIPVRRTPDGYTHIEAVSWRTPGYPQPLVDGHPQHIWETLIDNEDSQGRVPCER